jgi:hypothetical protein
LLLTFAILRRANLGLLAGFRIYERSQNPHARPIHALSELSPPQSSCPLQRSYSAGLQVFAGALPALAQAPATVSAPLTRTPIKQVIVILGENRTFDHIFATYKPLHGNTVDNLLSKKIINADGTLRFRRARHLPRAQLHEHAVLQS